MRSLLGQQQLDDGSISFLGDDEVIVSDDRRKLEFPNAGNIVGRDFYTFTLPLAQVDGIC